MTVTSELDALVALMPFAAELGLVLVEASAERVVAQLDWAPRLCTAGGILHGGVLMSLADSAGALVTFLGVAGGRHPPRRRPRRRSWCGRSARGTVRAVAVPLHRGRTMVTAQTSVYDDRERLVAQTTQVQTVR